MNEICFKKSVLLQHQCLYTFLHHCLQSGENSYASNDKRLTLQCIYASMSFPLMPLCTGLFVCTLPVAGLYASLCLHHSVLQHRLLYQLLSALPSSSAIILACQLARCDIGLCPYSCLLLYWPCLPDCTLSSSSLIKCASQPHRNH